MTSTHSDAAAAEVLDPRCLDQLRALVPAQGQDFLRRVLQTYLQSIDRHMQGLAQARHDQNAVAVSAAVHALKSASASVGAVALAAQCAALEQAAQAGWQSPLQEALPAFEDMVARTRAAVARELGPA